MRNRIFERAPYVSRVRGSARDKAEQKLFHRLKTPRRHLLQTNIRPHDFHSK